jgi:hypothetical protein
MAGEPVPGPLSGLEGAKLSAQTRVNNRPSGDTNINFEDFFSVNRIVGALAHLRLKTATRRHERQRLIDITASVPGLSKDTDWLGLFPPRQLWHANRENDRGPDSEATQRKALLRSIRRGLWSPAPDEWAVKMQALIHQIREAALATEGHRFQEPLLHPCAKSSPNEFRITATMKTVFDKVIDRMVASYLRVVAEPHLAPGVVAYRAAAGPDREVAIRQLADFRRRHAGADLFVAELDIRAFFDCASHPLVLRTLALPPFGDRLDPRARATLTHFLAAYDRGSICEQEAELRILHRLPADAVFPWPVEVLASFHGDLASSRIGLPQGTAISTVLANLILHEADQASLTALRASTDGEAIFFRYSDDVVWVGTNEESVAGAQCAFVDALTRLKLPVHSPEPVSTGAAFYTSKSKLPYRWTQQAGTGSSRWVSFLGYQVNCDGQFRIRKATIKKLRRRMQEEIEEVLDLARRPGLRLSLPKLFRRTAGRLLAFTIGRLGRVAHYQNPDPRCWASAFRQAGASGPVYGQLRKLDHYRHRKLDHLFRQLLRLAKTNEERDDLRAAASPNLHPSAPRSFVARFRRLQNLDGWTSPDGQAE